MYGGEVDVAAGENYAKFGRGGIEASGEIQVGCRAWAEQGSYGHGAAWLDDDFHALPDQAHGGDDFFFGDEEDAIDVAAENGEGARGQGRAKAVGDGVAGIERLESASGEGAIGIVGAGRFAAEDVDIGAEGFGAQASTAKETASADGSEDGVEVGDFFQKFFCGGGLAGDDPIVVVGMDEDGAGFGLNACAGFSPRGHGGFGERDFAAVAFDGAAFYWRSVFWHDDVGGDAAPRGGTGYGSSVIAARGSDDAMSGFRIGEGEDRVGRAANFEGPGFLEIVALEEKLDASDGVQGMRSEDGSAMDARGDEGVSFADRVPGRRLIIGGFDLWSSAHRKP